MLDQPSRLRRRRANPCKTLRHTTTLTCGAPGHLHDQIGPDGAVNYRYDAANRLIETVTNGITTTYAYDGWGSLIREVVNASGVITTTDYLLDEQAALPRVVGELRGDGTQVQYAYGPEGVAAQRTLSGGASEGVIYPLLDAQASLRALTDASGAVVRRVTYDAWGQVRQTTGSAWTRLGYTGEPMGGDGTVYLRARHYQPSLGRFLQRDGFPGIPERPQSLHKYLYAENNPATFTDPSGQVVIIPVLLAVWAIAEVALQIYDTYDTLNTVFDPCISLWEKGFVATLYVGGLFLPGGGYGTGGKAVLRHGDDAYRFVRWGDEAADGARLLDNGDDLARHADDAEQIRVVDEVVDGLCSFSPDTPVATADGPRPIVELQVGDLVLAYHEGLRTTGGYTVTAIWAHADPVILHVTLDGETIETTPEHPFFVLLRGWVSATELRVGDAVRRADGSYGLVADVAVVQRPQTMYNLTVAGAHTFFVGDQGWLVHNACHPFDKKTLKSIEKILSKYPVIPVNSGKCDYCARELYDLLQKLGYNVEIGRMDTDLPKITTKSQIPLSTRLGSSPAYHEFIKVDDLVIDGLTGASGMKWQDYMNLFYEGVFDDGTIRLSFSKP